MLRSRSNRQQRPSESTDEQQGRRSGSGSYNNYGGYPSSGTTTTGSSSGGGGGNPMMVGIASGADDDYSYGGGGGGGANAKSKGRGGGGGSRFGFGSGSSSAHNKKKDDRHVNVNDVWDQRNMGSTIKGNSKGGGGGGGSTGMILLAMGFVLIIAMGGATMHYRKANDRMQHELMVVKRRMKTGGRFRHGGDDAEVEAEVIVSQEESSNEQESNSNNDNDNNSAATNNISLQDMIDLRTKSRDLQGEKHKWETRAKSLSNELIGLQSQISHLERGEMESYTSQIKALNNNLVEEKQRAKDFKRQFMDSHRSGKTGIIAGGPGHSLVQTKELDSMESLDDYEDYVQRREDALWDKIDLLVEKLGIESRREAIEWFGPGPHTVELEIEYPKYTEDTDPSEWPRVRGVFTMEMAPLDLMPIAVNLFLQQVHHKLWNGCSFVINAMHILQAGPHKYTENGQYDANQAELVSRFETSRLDKMPFQEYHADYPHSQFTVGFAGRPGGPDFYINKVDNSVNHGPGGQSQHDIHEEADPCFAKLSGGAAIILRDLSRIPVDYDKGSLLLHSVEIVDSRVILATRNEEEEAQEQQQNNDENGSNEANNAEQGVENQSNEQQNEQDEDQGSGFAMPAMGPSPAGR